MWKGNSYSVAFVREDGEFDVLERFIADDDDEANDYAERGYAGQEWFVLDSRGRNINGDEQS
jgi:hypothetical protein